MQTPEVIQYSLSLLPQISFEELISQKKIANLTVEFSSRMSKSWKLLYNRFTQQRVLTIPKILSEAPREVKEAMVSWAMMPNVTGKKAAYLKEQKKTLERIIWMYIADKTNKPLHPNLKKDTLDGTVEGTIYNLQEVFDTVNREYFENSLHSYLRWGSPNSKISYQTNRLAPDGKVVNLITIAGIYNHPQIPRFAIESIMFHEMLHIKIPPQRKGTKNSIHSREFKNAERKFKYYKEWITWEKQFLVPLLRKIRKSRN